jgi:hypothetical protein
VVTELAVGDKVRVHPLRQVGQITRVATGKLKRWPYLVLVPGFGERSFGADELEQLPAGATVPTLPPPPTLP